MYKQFTHPLRIKDPQPMNFLPQEESEFTLVLGDSPVFLGLRLFANFRAERGRLFQHLLSSQELNVDYHRILSPHFNTIYLPHFQNDPVSSFNGLKKKLL